MLIDEYQEMLERLEDIENLKLLEDLRERPLKFRRPQGFLAQPTSS